MGKDPLRTRAVKTWTPGGEARESVPTRDPTTPFHLSAFASCLRACGAIPEPQHSARHSQPDTATTRGVGPVVRVPTGPATVKACSWVSSREEHRRRRRERDGRGAG